MAVVVAAHIASTMVTSTPTWLHRDADAHHLLGRASTSLPLRRTDEVSIALRAPARGACPVPTLVVTNLHVVMCCVVCSVTCARCWAAL